MNSFVTLDFPVTAACTAEGFTSRKIVRILGGLRGESPPVCVDRHLLLEDGGRKEPPLMPRRETILELRGVVSACRHGYYTATTDNLLNSAAVPPATTCHAAQSLSLIVASDRAEAAAGLIVLSHLRKLSCVSSVF